MKQVFTTAILVMLSLAGFGQNVQNQTSKLPPPLPSREVSGVVKDSTGQRIMGASVVLKSSSDTLTTVTNEDGIFILKDVKLATFNITVQSVGFITFIKKYLNSDMSKRIVLAPIILGTSLNELPEAKISGAPSIIYKTDTVEFRASDYKVRENATLDELLKKMEGMEVNKNGKLTYQGEDVTLAKLNGKEFAGGNIAQVIQSLPAEIIEKAQIVDDYGDQAARTGIKEGPPQKILNVTTKPERSVGTTGQADAQGGNHDRYNTNLFVQRINANRQLGIQGNFRNMINGIQGAGLGGGNGVTQSGAPSFNYRDQWSKNTQVIGGYNYNFNNTDFLNNSYGQRFSNLGTSDFTSNYSSNNRLRLHSARFEVDMNLNSANYLQIQPSYNAADSPSQSNSYSDNINKYLSGFEHPVINTIGLSESHSNNYAVKALYMHMFKKPKRNFSFQGVLGRSDARSGEDNNTDFKYFGDNTQNLMIRDSLVHLLSYRTNRVTDYQATFTYAEPVNKRTMLEFRAEYKRTYNNYRSTQDTVLSNGKVQELSRLNNIYNYYIDESRLSFNYRYSGTKLNLSIGAAVLPYSLSGNKVDNANGSNIKSTISSFRVIPALQASYAFSSTERFILNYSGRNTSPAFQQIQPFIDRSNPDFIIVGNPDLKPAFFNTATAQYNNYIANSRFNFSLGVTATNTAHLITTNTLLVRVPLTQVTYKNLAEVHYVNLDGANAVTGRYSVSKLLANRKYQLALNGDVSYAYTPAMSNGALYHQTNWKFSERFAPRINPNENFEINPFIGYDVVRTSTTLLNAKSTSLETSSFGLDSRMYFSKTWQVNYSASQRFIRGITGPNTNSLVINAGIQKQFLPKKNLVMTLDVYDLLHQNNYVQQTVTSTRVVNTLSNALSRYFMLGVRLNIQKWNGVPQRNGMPMMRRGDGSFIYN